MQWDRNKIYFSGSDDWLKKIVSFEELSKMIENKNATCGLPFIACYKGKCNTFIFSMLKTEYFFRLNEQITGQIMALEVTPV